MDTTTKATLRKASYFVLGWQYAEAYPKAICPDLAPLPLSMLPTPAWAMSEWFDGFLSQREAAYKKEMSQESKATDCLPSRSEAMKSKRGKK